MKKSIIILTSLFFYFLVTLSFSCSTKYFNTMSSDPEALFPDYPVDLTSQDYLNGRDPILDFILNYKTR